MSVLEGLGFFIPSPSITFNHTEEQVADYSSQNEEPDSYSKTRVWLSIDGEHVSSTPGTTIMKAARDHGIRIPSLCNDPRLIPVGNCGICQVEVGGEGLVMACKTPVYEGMDVVTLSPEIAEVRKERLSEFLSNHNA
jgi:formate dehydrogenase major subunit